MRLATILNFYPFKGLSLLQGVSNFTQVISVLFSLKHGFVFKKEVFVSALYIFIFICLVAGLLLMFFFSKKYKGEIGRSKGLKKARVDKFAAINIDEMIGLANVKRELEKIIGYYKVQRERKKKGLAASDLNLNLVFYGNPGTGKTVVARYLAQELAANGIISTGVFIECDRSSLIAQYQGQTAMKTREVAESALGGVLFIDEAYTLTAGKDSYGQEAVDTLLKIMEDYKEDLVVIVAGYDDLMHEFISSNPGLESRFTKHIKFDDYTAAELVKILTLDAKKRDYSLTDGAKDLLEEAFQTLIDNRDKNFANGRLARNIFEELAQHQAERVGSRAHISKADMMTIDEDDVRVFIDEYGIDVEDE